MSAQNVILSSLFMLRTLLEIRMINGKTNARIKSPVSSIDFHILYSITCLIFRFLLDICLYHYSDFVESLLAFVSVSSVLYV